MQEVGSKMVKESYEQLQQRFEQLDANPTKENLVARVGLLNKLIDIKYRIWRRYDSVEEIYLDLKEQYSKLKGAT